jgi:hypothetical protein
VNRLMLGHCLVHARFDESEPVMNSTQRHSAAARLGADLFADQSFGVMLVLGGRWHEAREYLERGLVVATRVGARRYETSLLLQLSEANGGPETGARRALIEKARAKMDETTFGFVGPALYAYAAVASDAAAERHRLPEEGEARLAEHSRTPDRFYRAASKFGWRSRN